MFRKNALFTLLLALLLCLSLATAALAADIEVLVDGNAVKTLDEFDENDRDDQPFCLDVPPEVRDGRVFVPLRLLAELLGVEVAWQGENVTLRQGEEEIQLDLATGAYVRGGQTGQLDAVPLRKEGRVLVPLRYVAEWFGCDVAWQSGQVRLTTAPLMLNGVKAAYLRDSSRMTMGSQVYEQHGDLLLRNIYDVLALGRGAEVAEPERYGYNADIGDYHEGGQFVFYDTDGNVLADFTLYRITFWPPSPPEGYTAQLVLDNQTNQWYLLDDAAYARLQKWQISFDWVLVEDTVA